MFSRHLGLWRRWSWRSDVNWVSRRCYPGILRSVGCRETDLDVLTPAGSMRVRHCPFWRQLVICRLRSLLRHLLRWRQPQQLRVLALRDPWRQRQRRLLQRQRPHHFASLQRLRILLPLPRGGATSPAGRQRQLRQRWRDGHRVQRRLRSEGVTGYHCWCAERLLQDHAWRRHRGRGHRCALLSDSCKC